MSYTPGNAPNRTGRGMVRRTYYLPRDVVAELDRAVVGAQASAYVERAPDKSAVVAAVVRAGLRSLPEVIDELRTSPAASGEPPPAATTRVRGWERPVAVPDTLDELRGPTTGVVRLPISVHASGAGPNQQFDLSRPESLIAMYEIVLTEGRLEDVQRLVNGAELRQLWPRLWLPTHVLGAWREQFPELGAGLRGGPGDADQDGDRLLTPRAVARGSEPRSRSDGR